MKRLILDHFRRKAWQLILCAPLIILSGFLAVAGANAFVQIQIALFTGGMLLFFDLQQGIARALASLPLSARQIGRAWWLATVAIPAIAITALLFLCAGISKLAFPNAEFPARSLATTSLFTLLWLGSFFVLILRIRSGLHGSWWQRTGGWSGLLILCVGLISTQGLWKGHIAIWTTCAVGGPLTAAGWFFAGQLASGCSGVRSAGTNSKNPPGRHRASRGFGGIPRLISATFTRSFLIGLAFLAAMALMETLGDHPKSWRQASESIVGLESILPFWIIFLQLLPILSGLRFLRTLPVSATKLAALMIAMTILPLVALGATMAGMEGLISGSAAAITLSRSFAFALIPAPICVFFAVWRGIGRETYAILILAMICSQNAPDWIASFFPNRVIPLPLTGAVLGISFTLGFLFTRRSIMQSSLTYRVQATSFGNIRWGMGR